MRESRSCACNSCYVASGICYDIHRLAQLYSIPGYDAMQVVTSMRVSEHGQRVSVKFCRGGQGMQISGLSCTPWPGLGTQLMVRQSAGFARQSGMSACRSSRMPFGNRELDNCAGFVRNILGKGRLEVLRHRDLGDQQASFVQERVARVSSCTGRFHWGGNLGPGDAY